MSRVLNKFFRLTLKSRDTLTVFNTCRQIIVITIALYRKGDLNFNNLMLGIFRTLLFKFWRCEALVHFDTSEIFVYITKFHQVASFIYSIQLHRNEF